MTMYRAALMAAVLVVLSVAPGMAQNVRGRVIDAQTGQPLGDVRVTLLRALGGRVTDVVTDAQGRFQVNAPDAGEYRLQTSHIAYQDVWTPAITVGPQEQVVVDVKVTAAAVTLEPLTIVARRADPRHDPSEAGMYARRLRLPPIGNARVFIATDPEMQHAGTVVGLMDYTRKPRGCTVMFWNGVMVQDTGVTRELWNTPVADLEGVEYYRTPADAPHAFQDMPTFANWTERGGGAMCSVVALWPRTGRFALEYLPPLQLTAVDSRRGLGAVLYHVSGSLAPGIGAGAELTGHWPVKGIEVGLHVRATRHQLGRAAADSIKGTLSDIAYVLEPGELGNVLVSAGVEPRYMLRETDRLRVDVGVRGQVAVRRFKLQENKVRGRNHAFNSAGAGGGASLQIAYEVRDQLSASLGLGYDLLRFQAYPGTERTGLSTAGTWHGYGLRLGLVWATH